LKPFSHSHAVMLENSLSDVLSPYSASLGSMGSREPRSIVKRPMTYAALQTIQHKFPAWYKS